MKKNILKSTIILFLLSIFIVSCNKEDIQNEISKTKIERENIEIVNLKTIPIKDGVLQFTSFNQFINAIMQIQKECNLHTKNYCVPLSEKGLSEEQINEKAQKEGFDQFKPISNFESINGFNSLYSVLRLEEKEWFKNETLDENEDPFRNIEKYEAVFCNKDGIVSINGKNISLNNKTYSLKAANAVKSYEWKDHRTYKYYSSNPKKIKGNVGPRPFQGISSTTLYGKNIWGNWYLYMSRIWATTWGEVHPITPGNPPTCNHYLPAVSLPYTSSLTYWSAYVFNSSWMSLSGHGSEWNEKIIKSRHATWGKNFGHAF